MLDDHGYDHGSNDVILNIMQRFMTLFEIIGKMIIRQPTVLPQVGEIVHLKVEADEPIGIPEDLDWYNSGAKSAIFGIPLECYNSIVDFWRVLKGMGYAVTVGHMDEFSSDIGMLLIMVFWTLLGCITL